MKKKLEGCVIPRLIGLNFDIFSRYVNDNNIKVEECLACERDKTDCECYMTERQDRKYLRIMEKYLR